MAMDKMTIKQKMRSDIQVRFKTTILFCFVAILKSFMKRCYSIIINIIAKDKEE